MDWVRLPIPRRVSTESYVDFRRRSHSGWSQRIAIASSCLELCHEASILRRFTAKVVPVEMMLAGERA